MKCVNGGINSRSIRVFEGASKWWVVTSEVLCISSGQCDGDTLMDSFPTAARVMVYRKETNLVDAVYLPHICCWGAFCRPVGELQLQAAGEERAERCVPSVAALLQLGFLRWVLPCVWCVRSPSLHKYVSQCVCLYGTLCGANLGNYFHYHTFLIISMHNKNNV